MTRREKIKELVSNGIFAYRGDGRDVFELQVGTNYFVGDVDEEESDGEITFWVDKEWLLTVTGSDNPQGYIESEYTYDDSYEWFMMAVCRRHLAGAKIRWS